MVERNETRCQIDRGVVALLGGWRRTKYAQAEIRTVQDKIRLLEYRNATSTPRQKKPLSES